MKESIVGFAVAAGLAVWFFTGHPEFLMPLIVIGGAAAVLLLIAAVVWYGLVQLRIFLRI